MATIRLTVVASLRCAWRPTTAIYRGGIRSPMSSNSELPPLSISMVGCGKMAEAIAAGIKSDNFPYKASLDVYDIHEDRMALFKERFGAKICVDLEECGNDANIVLLATKPQNLKAVAKGLGKFPSKTIVLSVMAGVTINQLEDCIRAKKIVRSMPNTPAAVQEGMTVWTATPALTQNDSTLVASMLGAFGDQHYVESEQYIDMATAISGSGPAYVLLLMESIIDTGVHFGMPRAVAARLAAQTVKGTAVYAQSSNFECPTLRADITSPGGTTAAALYYLERGGFRTVVADGLWSAYRRSLELGGNDSNLGPGRSQSK